MIPTPTHAHNTTSTGRKCCSPGQIFISIISLSLVAGLGMGFYFMADHLRWLGLLLVAHSVFTLTVILMNRSRREDPGFKSLLQVQF